MSPSTTGRLLRPDEAASRRRIRQYAVPRWMIEQATDRRLAGDWRGALTAALVEPAFDLDQVAGQYGAETAAALAEDLRHLAPDLLRWHLPRLLGGRTTLDTARVVVLARYRDADPDERKGTTPYLHVATPPMIDGPQRLTLRFEPVGAEQRPGTFGRTVEDWRRARHLWDARRTGELLERCGGSAERAPFFHADATPVAEDRLPAADPGQGDPAARAEWLTLAHQRGGTAEGLAAAGHEFVPTAPETSRWYRSDPAALLAQLELNHARLEPEVRRLVAEGLGERHLVRVGWRTFALLVPKPDGGLRVSVIDQDQADGAPVLPEALWRRLPDLDLLREGGITADRLHPLVRAALFPALAATADVGPPGPTPPEPVRVRCRGEWHEVGFRPDGLLRMPHSDEEQQRERAMRAFGGAVAGCFAVEQTWSSGSGRLPRGLTDQRRELFLRAQHGDTPGVLAMLDAGTDPRVRDASGRTLLHVLNLLDHEALLPRLLAAGLDLEACDSRDRTPLYVAVNDLGSRALVEALIAAGARLDPVDRSELSLAQIVRRYKRTDLAFLRERVQAEHPDIGADWWDEWMDEQEEYWAEQDGEDEDE
ncbi:ankyrin repeat domain-containing protein [Kitasatospora cinereorecta]|uniref:Ankyrin repeat domain-containing protein n=1 Tax=Kitasatospora cinereorecta TaxID=285560 RepID=A0ABW0VH29_9ACTN